MDQYKNYALKLIVFFLLQFCGYSAYCQTDNSKFNSDSLKELIKRLPEYKEEQKHYDSIKKFYALSAFSVGTIQVSHGDSITFYGSIQEQLDTILRTPYRFKYDMKLKKLVLIERQY